MGINTVLSVRPAQQYMHRALHTSEVAHPIGPTRLPEGTANVQGRGCEADAAPCCIHDAKFSYGTMEKALPQGLASYSRSNPSTLVRWQRKLELLAACD